MAPLGQYVFAEMLGISEHFTAGSHEWLPYSVIPTFPKQICKQQFTFPCGGGGVYVISDKTRKKYSQKLPFCELISAVKDV